MDRANQSRSRNARRMRPGRKTGKGRERLHVFLVYVIPFLLINSILFILVAARPHITIYAEGTSDYKSTTITVQVNSLLPLTEFTSTQEDSPLELTQTGKGEYTAQITKNGVIEIYVKSINGMTARQYEHINILDDTAPLVGEQYSIEDGILTLTLEDSQSGLDQKSVYATNDAGETILPSSYDEAAGRFTFQMGEQTLYIHASDLAGNAMQATFSTHMETLDPEGQPVEEESWAEDQQAAQQNTSEADLEENSPEESQPESSHPAETQESAAIYIDTQH